MYLHPASYDFCSLDFTMFDPTDLAWVAGFIDGDGCIAMYHRTDHRRKNEFSLKLNAVNTNLDCLQKIQFMFGGSIHTLHKGDDSRNWKKSWVWVTSDRRAEKVLDAISPYLVIKRDQAMLAFEMRELVDTEHKQHRSEETITKLNTIKDRFRELNRKGR